MTEYAWKAGDEIFVPANRSWSGFPGVIYNIDRVTPSGRAHAAGMVFDKTGRQMGTRSYSRAIPATSEHREEIDLFRRRVNLEERVSKIKWRELSNESVLAITAAIEAIK